MLKSLLFFAVFVLCACGSDPTTKLIADRPYNVTVPTTYNGSPTPLIVTLHGLGETGLLQATDSGLLDLAETRGFILAYPDGEFVLPGIRGWNASCCDLALPTDDVAYVRAVIEDASRHYNIEPTKVYVTGYSNGAFMAHLMACEASDLIAAISIYAGTMILGEETKCQPSSPVAVMHTHGTSDTIVAYNGGTLNFGLGSVNYISAESVVQHWIALDDCDPTAATETFDVDSGLAGSETTIFRYSGCQQEINVELWKVDGGTHTPILVQTYRDAVIDFLYAHPKRT